MDWNWALLLAHILFYTVSFGSEIVVQVNTKKWIYYVPERFLSVTVDPLTLAAAGPLTQESYNMAKGLSPSFVRLGGFGTSALIFGKQFQVNGSTVSESQWDSVNDFARGTGLDIIASLNPTTQVQGVWDSQNSLELISYSNKKRYNVAWQLGYDLRGYNANGAEIGRDLVRLTKILDGFSMYAGSPVFSPDLSSVSGAKQIHFIKDMMTNAGNSLGSIILQPKFMNDVLDEDPYDLMTSMINELDTYVWNKEVRVGKAVHKKPIWIAEPTASKGSFSEAMKLVKRIGVAARIGVQIYMRQAGMDTLKVPTPDFWFSLLYKNLVGQGVLDNKIVSQNQSDLHVFAHCTASVPQDKSVLDTDWNYDKGAVTVFGTNESPEPVKLVLKITSKEEPLHVYILTSVKKNEKDKAITLLNGQELMLSPTWELPVLSPKVKRPSKSTSVNIPGESIFFIVMPESKIRTCSVPPLATPDFNLSELTKRLRLTPQKLPEVVEEDIEPSEEPMEEGVYVTFVKKKRHNAEVENNKISRVDTLGKTLMQTLISKLAPRKLDIKTERPPEEEIPVKYITFNENSFLNKLAEGVKEELKQEDEAEEESVDRKQKYAPLTEAMTKPEIISIEPIQESVKISSSEVEPVSQISEEKDASRLKRSCSETPPTGSKDLSVKEPIDILKKISEAKKAGATMNSEMNDVVSSLNQVVVTFKNLDTESDKEDDKTRNVRHIGNDDGEMDERMPVHTDASKKVSDSESTDEREKDCDNGEDVDKKTSELMKIVQETEKVESVSESTDGVMIPPGVNEKKLDEMMLETAKSNSEPEPDSDSQTKVEEPSTIQDKIETSKDKIDRIVLSVAEQPSVRPTNGGQLQVPVLNQPEAPSPDMLRLRSEVESETINQPPNTPIGTAGETPITQRSSPVMPPITLLQQIPEKSNIQTTSTMKINHIQKIAPTQGGNDQPSMVPERVSIVPMLVSAEPSSDPQVPYYNEQKENAINNILEKIATKEDAKMAKSPEVLKPGEVETSEPLMLVPLPGKDAIVMAREDVKTCTEEGKFMENIKTLDSENVPIDLTSVVDNTPKVKVLRQVGTKALRVPKIAVTPLSQTATLSTPAEETVAATPAGPVSPFKSSAKDVKLAQENEPREPLKAPTPEELRERFKTLREKMLELRSQYVAAREKRLEDIKKQVASRGPSTVNSPEDPIKSTIRRRETELKEWFKKFDKRETEQNPITVPLESAETVKTRPRRLSLFSDNEGMDMEKFFDEEPSESFNSKRSPDANSRSTQQNLRTTPNLQTASKCPEPKIAYDTIGKSLFPLDAKTHGIIYNNKIYPAKLYGFIEHPDVDNLENEDKPSVAVSPKLEEQSEKDTYNKPHDGLNMPREFSRSRERVAFVPRDAFIRETKSEFIPVIIIPPEDDEPVNPKSYDASTGRAKRSTLDTLEDQFHQIKEEIFPKISSWIKNFRENPPWKRDLDRSSRNRRSLEDILRTNDLRSLYSHPKIPRRRISEDEMPNATAIEDLVLKSVDKGENELYSMGKKYTKIAEEIGDDLVENRDSNDQKDKIGDIKYCEEVGTSTKSIIRDPFNEQRPIAEKMMNSDKTSGVQSASTKTESTTKSPSSTLERMEESMFAAVIADRIKQFVSTVGEWMGIAGVTSESK